MTKTNNILGCFSKVALPRVIGRDQLNEGRKFVGGQKGVNVIRPGAGQIITNRQIIASMSVNYSILPKL